VNGIKSHQTGVGFTENRVEICAIIVHLSTGLMDNFCCFSDLGFEKTECAGIGDHHGSGIVTDDSSKCIQIKSTIVERWNFNNLVPTHCCTRWIRTMCTVWHDDFVAVFLTDISMIFLNTTHCSKFPLRTCNGLQCHSIHSCTVCKHLLHLMENRHHSLQMGCG